MLQICSQTIKSLHTLTLAGTRYCLNNKISCCMLINEVQQIFGHYEKQNETIFF